MNRKNPRYRGDPSSLISKCYTTLKGVKGGQMSKRLCPPKCALSTAQCTCAARYFEHTTSQTFGKVKLVIVHLNHAYLFICFKYIDGAAELQ